MDNIPFERGWSDYMDGKLKCDNPYPLDSYDHSQWIKGFHEGEKDDVEQDPEGN